MNHYVYLLRSEKYHYVGVRSCRGPIATDRYMGSGTRLKATLKGGVKFKKTVLCVADSREEALAVEGHLIGPDEVADYACLNLVQGGLGTTGYRHTDETRNEMSRRKAGVRQTEEHNARRAESHTGHRHTDESRARMSASHAGKTLSDAHREALSRAGMGRTCGWESRSKSSATKRGVDWTPAYMEAYRGWNS